MCGDVFQIALNIAHSVCNDISWFNVYPTHRLQRWVVRPRLAFVTGVCAADFRGCGNRWYCVSLNVIKFRILFKH